MTRAALAEFLDRHLTRPMFFAAFLFLVVLAGACHRLKDPQIADLEITIILGSFLALWPFFLVEAVVRFQARNSDALWRRLTYCLAIALVPPLRLGSSGYGRTNEIWLPLPGWSPVDRKLRQRLERIFSVPMILLALLTLPVLGIEYFWREQVETHPWLAFVLDLSTSVIWLGFAVELIIMASVAERPASYLLRHWLDLAIVLLPIVEVLPALRTLRALRVMRIEQLTRFGRAYRLRALVMKLWHAVLLLEVIQRLTGQSPAKRLARLRYLLAAKEDELADLRTEIAQLERQITGQKKAAEQKEDQSAAGGLVQQERPAETAARQP
jgi:voltage-gated potassium channel